MKKRQAPLRFVDQTRFHAEGELPGDCYAACLATLLGCSIEEVPRPEMDERVSWIRYWPRIADFLHSRGVHLLHLPGTGDWNENNADGGTPIAKIWTTSQFWECAPVYAIASGKSPRGPFDHSVVVDVNRGIVHDPHPSRAGIETCTSVEFLLPLHGARLDTCTDGRGHVWIVTPTSPLAWCTRCNAERPA